MSLTDSFSSSFPQSDPHSGSQPGAVNANIFLVAIVEVADKPKCYVNSEIVGGGVFGKELDLSVQWGVCQANVNNPRSFLQFISLCAKVVV